MTPVSPGRFVPLLVRAQLAAGIAHATPWGIALDGLLASEIWHDRKARLRDQGQPGPLDVADPEDLELPLARCAGTSGLWHWAATCAFPEGYAAPLPEVRYWTGRIDPRACEQTARTLPARIPEQRGRWRARRMPLLVTITPSVTWHAVGDAAAVRGLLANIAAIGKKRGSGEGQVLSWEVLTATGTSEWEAAHLHPDGRLGRPTPPGCLAGRTVADGGFGTAGLRPPYHHPARQHPLHLPVPATAEP